MGVLDIGSNTVHLLLVDAHYGAAPIPASKKKIPLRLAENLEADGSIAEVAVEQLIQFIIDGQQLAEDLGATHLMAFATSAIRDAPNGQRVLDQIAEKTSLQVEVLSGEDEARMTFLAVRRWFGWSSGRLLVVDIGGGSLELASGTDEEPDVALSLPLGAGRMTRDFLKSDPPRPEEIRALRKHARVHIAEVVGLIRRAGEPRRVVATSKTLKQLARIAGAAPSSEGIYVERVLSAVAVRQLVESLSTLNVAERSSLPGVSTGRAAQLLAGALVAEAAIDLLDVTELVVCPWALREGLILHRMDGLTR
jgi:exopolyphosphatase/guanosine-5'-triphosphate,3'-diphosphate pyrophosphatase